MILADPFEDAEIIEQVLIVGLVATGVYLLYKAIDEIGKTDWWKQLSANPQVSGPSNFVGNSKPLSYPQAQGIAQALGVTQGATVSWQLSPDAFQIWFGNGAYYDNRTGHLYDKDGNDKGRAINGDGSVNENAFEIIGNVDLPNV